MSDRTLPTDASNDPNGRALALREIVKRVFPAEVYDGAITPVDGQGEPDLDEEQALYAALRGKDWIQVQPTVISENPDGVVLLTEQVFAAFLPAWLMRSLDEIAGENETRELVTYSFGGSSDHMLRRLQTLTRDQRSAVRDVMELFSTVEQDPFIRAHAERAVQFIDSVSSGSVN